MVPKIKKHTHATPQVYLRRFVVGGRLMAQRPGEEPIELGTPVVGVRKRFYTLKLSDGTSSDVIEDSLATLESVVNSAFALVDAGNLPLQPGTKALLAEFIGTQISRGVAYRQLRREFLPSQEPMLRERVRELFRTHAPHRIAEAEEYDLMRVVEDDSALR